MAIAQEILEIVQRIAAEHGTAKVTRVSLLVGQMTRLEPESLTFGFAALAGGTVAEGAELAVTIVPLTGRCNDCGQEFVIEQFRFFCPFCESAGVAILSGRELSIEHLEVDE
jgi:hydrogenase nickel incorporation protein HypA/HybF